MTGLLLVNLGTPDEPTTPAVRRYLRQFLNDPRVIDLHPVGRALLLFVILTLKNRAKTSAEAYRKIWSAEGSPLRHFGEALAGAVRERLGAAWAVALGMRYGSPSLESALEQLLAAGCDRVVVLPLYPQYSSASTGSSVEELFRLAAKRWVTPSFRFIEPFYDDAGFLDAFAAVGRPVLDAETPDHVLFSFHGLPERHMRKADASGAHCFSSANCCDAIKPVNRHCYRAQCFATARSLAARLALPDGRWSVSFQSRLGRDPWIRPYTDVVVPELARAGCRRLVVFSPAFVADCLETLEEIGLRAAADFTKHGGHQLTLVPSLNATPAWVDAVTALVRRAAP